MSDALAEVRQARTQLSAASAELRRAVVAAIASAEHTVTDIAAAADITRPTAYRWWHDSQTDETEEPVTTYMLISAVPGDRVPGTEVSAPDCPIDIHDYPDAVAWARSHGWGDDLDELVYVADPSEAGDLTGWPTYILNTTSSA